MSTPAIGASTALSLLLLWVGAAALLRGVEQIVPAFSDVTS